MYRKLKAARLFDGRRFVEDKVLVLAPDGTVEDLVPENEAGGDLQLVDGILSPGLINCHCHLELSHMKGLIPEKTGLVDFVFKVVSERHHSEETIREAIARGEDELLRSGVVAVGDICNNDLTLAQKSKRRITYSNFIEASGWLPTVAPARLERSVQLYEEYKNILGDDALVSIVPHAPYSVSGELWQAIAPYFRQKTVSIHNQETAFEDELFEKGTGDFLRMYQLMNMSTGHHQPTGRSSLLSYIDRLQSAARILLVHNTFTQPRDLEGLKELKSHPPISFCLCVNANLYIENSLPPVELLRQSGCRIVLGTDSLASNHTLSIADEMKTLRQHFPSLPLEELLQWATLNGAQALGLDGRFGSFEKGKKPGFTIIHEKDLSAHQLA